MKSTTTVANRGSVNETKQGYFTSIGEIENTFFNYAADAGVSFTKRPLIADGKLHREQVDGDKCGTKNGAYVLHADGKPSGWFLHYKTGISGKWTLSGKREPITKKMRAEIERERPDRVWCNYQNREKSLIDEAKFFGWAESQNKAETR